MAKSKKPALQPSKTKKKDSEDEIKVFGSIKLFQPTTTVAANRSPYDLPPQIRPIHLT